VCLSPCLAHLVVINFLPLVYVEWDLTFCGPRHQLFAILFGVGMLCGSTHLVFYLVTNERKTQQVVEKCTSSFQRYIVSVDVVSQSPQFVLSVREYHLANRPFLQQSSIQTIHIRRSSNYVPTRSCEGRSSSCCCCCCC
jgi:hypothetical protein